MKLKISLLLLFCCSLCSITNAKTIDLGDRLSIDVGEDFVQDTKSNYKYTADSKDIYISIYKRETDYEKGYEMDKKKVFLSLDTICFNLSTYKHLSTENQDTYDMQNSYCIKKFENKGYYALTYTSFVKDKPFCVVFSYNKQSDIKSIETQIDEIIKSIKYNGNFFRQGVNSFRHAGGNWIMLMFSFCIMTLILTTFKMSDHAKNIIAICMTIGFIVTAGILTQWTVALIIFHTLIVFIPIVICAHLGWSDIFKAIIDNI